MTRITVFILLMVHLNFSAFIPQFQETDRKGKNGTMVDDINSLSEFVYEVVLDHKDTTPEDEDNDQARDFHVLKLGTSFCQNVVVIQFFDLEKDVIVIDPIPVEEKISSVFFEIPSPPPKA